MIALQPCNSCKYLITQKDQLVFNAACMLRAVIAMASE